VPPRHERGAQATGIAQPHGGGFNLFFPDLFILLVGNAALRPGGGGVELEFELGMTIESEAAAGRD
jgi:hypothetical protein